MKQITIKAARVNCGLTQEQAAKLIGVSKPTLVNWEIGRTLPKATQFRRLLEVYGFDEGDIFLP